MILDKHGLECFGFGMCFLLESTYIFIGPVDTAYRGEQECV